MAIVVRVREKVQPERSEPLTPDLLEDFGFEKVFYEQFDRSLFVLSLPWGSGHAQTRRPGSYFKIVLAQVATPDLSRPQWGFGFYFCEGRGSPEEGCTITSQVLEHRADLEQLLFGLGYEVEESDPDLDDEALAVKNALLRIEDAVPTVYRHNQDTIRVKLECSVFRVQTFDERHAWTLARLRQYLPDYSLDGIHLMVLTYPGEMDSRIARLDHNFKHKRGALEPLPGVD